MSGREAEALWVLLPSGQQASGIFIDDTLKARAAEKGLTDRLTLAAQFPRQRVEVVRGDDGFAAVNELFYRRGWTDGLPVVPPTLGRVEEMLAASSRVRGEVIGEIDPLKGLATVEKVAVNAVMAGCRPEYFPVVLTAVAAVVEPDFNMRGVQTTDENVAPLLIVNGPLAERLQVNAGFGALGPGWQANAAIGRALRLVMHNIGGGWPGAVSFAGLGQPGRYTLCLAENEAQSPWEPLHVELGHAPETSTLTVMRAEAAVNVTGGLAEIVSVMGSALSSFAQLHNGRVCVVLAPFTAQQLAKDGWSKADVKQYLHRHGRVPVAQWRQSWMYNDLIEHDRWPDWVLAAEDDGAIPAVEKAEHITLIVAGGDVPIAQHAYFPSWGFPPCRIVRPVVDMTGDS